MPERIDIYIGRHLCTAPRAIKEADALAAAGYEVQVHGCWFDPVLVKRDQHILEGRTWRFTPYADCRTNDIRGRLRWWRLRRAHRLAREAWRRLGWVLPDVYGYGSRQLRDHAFAAPADLTIFHSEAGLYAAHQLRARGRRVGVDFEDWFSQDLTEAERQWRPLAAMAALEAESLRHDIYALAPSSVMAGELAAATRGRTPTVVYNAFPLISLGSAQSSDRVDMSRVSLHWFSQTLGADRGLETLFAALPLLHFPWELHLRGGDPQGHAQKLTRELPQGLREFVFSHPTVSSIELPAHIGQHDVGLALETGYCLNNDLTVSNKLFHYLQSGLALVASDTRGHREVLNRVPDAGRLFAANDRVALATALSVVCHDHATLTAAKTAATEAQWSIFAHEYQAGRYAELAARALAQK